MFFKSIRQWSSTNYNNLRTYNFDTTFADTRRQLNVHMQKLIKDQVTLW
jgi:hypothetical protein